MYWPDTRCTSASYVPSANTRWGVTGTRHGLVHADVEPGPLELVDEAVSLGADEHRVLPEHEIAAVAPDRRADAVVERLRRSPGSRARNPSESCVLGHVVHDRGAERHRRADARRHRRRATTIARS